MWGLVRTLKLIWSMNRQSTKTKSLHFCKDAKTKTSLQIDAQNVLLSVIAGCQKSNVYTSQIPINCASLPDEQADWLSQPSIKVNSHVSEHHPCLFTYMQMEKHVIFEGCLKYFMHSTLHIHYELSIKNHKQLA